MSLRTALLRTADVVRSLADATTLSGGIGLDVWIVPLTVITRTWPGEPGIGTPSDVPLVIRPNPEIRQVTAREVASSGGLYRPMDVRAQHLTPAYAGPPAGGYTPAQLAPRAPTRKLEIIYRLGGDLAGDYARIEARLSNPFEYVLVLRRMNTTP